MKKNYGFLETIHSAPPFHMLIAQASSHDLFSRKFFASDHI